jgi:hypothetical protein
MDIDLVRRLTQKYKRGGRVVVGHMAKLSLLPPEQVAPLARDLASSGIAVTVLPATDLFLMGRDQDHSVRRGVADANLLVEYRIVAPGRAIANAADAAIGDGDVFLEHALGARTESQIVASRSMIASPTEMSFDASLRQTSPSGH